MDILRIVLEIILFTLAATYQYAGFVVLHKAAASHHFQHQCFQPHPEVDDNLNVIFLFCREINDEKKNFCLVTNPRMKLKYSMFSEAES